MILAFMAIQLQEILVEKETRAMITFKLRYQSEKKKKVHMHQLAEVQEQ